MDRTAAVGVDVDSLRHYYRIHGLDERSATNAAWAVGVPRFIELFAQVGIPATFYCVAEDLELPGNPDRLRKIVAAGHEIGNHSWHHRYDLIQRPTHEQHAEIGTGRRQLEAAAGVPVTGFRSPGYNTTAQVISAVEASGHHYDSSVFPCAPYYLAKAAVMGVMRVGGRRSRSVLGDPTVLVAPHQPYQMSRTKPHRHGHGLTQFPISVSAGIPLIGTAFTALGRTGSMAATRLATATQDHLTLEFHAVDLLDLKGDGLDPILAIQPDLKVPVAKKRRIFRSVLQHIARNRRFERLDRLVLERMA